MMGVVMVAGCDRCKMLGGLRAKGPVPCDEEGCGGTVSWRVAFSTGFARDEAGEQLVPSEEQLAQVEAVKGWLGSPGSTKPPVPVKCYTRWEGER